MMGRSPRYARVVRRGWLPPNGDIPGPLGTGGNTGRVLVISKPSSSVAGCDLDGAGTNNQGHQRRLWASPGSLRWQGNLAVLC